MLNSWAGHVPALFLRYYRGTFQVLFIYFFSCAWGTNTCKFKRDDRRVMDENKMASIMDIEPLLERLNLCHIYATFLAKGHFSSIRFRLSEGVSCWATWKSVMDLGLQIWSYRVRFPPPPFTYHLIPIDGNYCYWPWPNLCRDQCLTMTHKNWAR